MRISQSQILDALGLSEGDLSKAELAVALKEIEKTIDAVSISPGDNDFQSARLGDASNLVQLMRESL